MSGFTAADMSTAAANGHRDGYQAGYADAVKAVAVSEMENTTGATVSEVETVAAAAQEAVAYREWHQERGDEPMESRLWELAPGQKVPEGAEPLYAALVAAAPVDPEHGRIDPAWSLHDRVEFALRDAGFDLDEAAFVAEAASAAQESTPAAPGIDLREPMRNLYRAYVRLLESGRDRIVLLGGHCDPVDVMEANDAALRAAPEGFVVVPVEPTEEMVDASLISVPIAKRINPGQHIRIYGARAWAAMLAARPQGVKDGR